MAGAIASVLGWAILLGVVGACVLAGIRRGKAHGILAPLLVGFALRLVVMVIVHFGSVSLGDHGILFLDDRTYFRGASQLANLWQAGHTPDPARAQILGTFQFGYQVFLAVIFTLSTSSVFLGKLVTVLIGTASILLVALLGGRMLGERAKVRAAWAAALAPSMVWWSASLSKEAIATFLLLAGLLAITYLPRPRAALVLGAVVAYLLILRGPAGIALVAGTVLAIALATRQAEGKWLSRPLKTFGVVVMGGFVLLSAVVSHGNLHLFFNQYEHVVNNMISQYQGGNPARVPFDIAKSLVTPLPWVFDRATENWDRGLYPGVWFIFCALPLAAMGIWRLRRSPEMWALLGTAGTAVTINAYASGFVFRQRSMIEPVIFIFALAGARSWQFAARMSSATLGVVAVAAGIHTGSPAVAGAVAAVAVALYLATYRLPSKPFEPLPESPLVAQFRASRAAATQGFSPRGLAGAAVASRRRLLRPLPRLHASATPPSRSPQSPAAAERARKALAAAAEVAPPLEPPGRGDDPARTQVAHRKLSAARARLVRLAPRLEPSARTRNPRSWRPTRAKAAGVRSALLRAASRLDPSTSEGDSTL